MKTLIRMSVMLLLACSLQNCQDLAFESVASGADAKLKASKQAKSTNDKHAFTISHVAPQYTSEYDQFLVYVNGTGGFITVDWGDGSSSTYDLGTEYGLELSKRYESPGRYLITITGDLKNITGFKSSYGQGPFDDINLRPLTGLTSLRVSNISGPQVIDLTHNKQLVDLSLYDMSELREIRLPKQHALWAVSVAASTNLTTETVDALINSVYRTAIKKQIWGFLHVSVSYYEDGTPEMVGPPSARSVTQLRELQNIYGWEIHPIM